MTDKFAGTSPGLSSPAVDAAAVTPNDFDALAYVSRAIYVGGGGNVRAELSSGAQVTFSAVPSGAILPIRATHILASGTTASGLVALW